VDTRRRGFTLIELLVVIAIIATLMGLLLPAVQKVRESAARAQCENNLHQIVVACAAYEADNGYLPPGSGTLAVGASVGDAASLRAIILPYIEQANLYNQFNFNQDINTGTANKAARQQEVKLYLCPSDPSTQTFLDPGGSGKPVGRYNYVGNVGTTADQQSTDGSRVGVFNFTFAPTVANTPTVVISRVRSTSISDGASTTAMWSETTRSMASGSNGGPTNHYDPTMVYFLPSNAKTKGGPDPGWSVTSPMVGPLTAENTPQALIQGMTYHCNAYDWQNTTDLHYRGLQYYRSMPELNQYTHTVPPNYYGYDCGNNDPGTAVQFTMAHMAARSYHTNGVNVAFCDGSIHFILNTIDFTLWQNLGTRSGGEAITEDY
jgi:prepilin-type N-terminal cleavage/methylation domain-containing protein/prepilin-type processing-associated H-X9-DG protein